MNPPPLTDMSKPWGVIEFEHTDGTRHKFYCATNEMSGNQLSAFDNAPPCINLPTGEVKKMFKNIRTKARRIFGYAGTKHFQ